MKYKIEDIEARKTTTVEASGFLEAMGEYLPGQSLLLGIVYKPHYGRVIATDQKTGFIYKVNIASEQESEKC